MKELSRRQFFTFCRKDITRDLVHAYKSYSEEMKKAEPKPSCEDLAFRMFGKKSGKSFPKNKKLFT